MTNTSEEELYKTLVQLDNCTILLQGHGAIIHVYNIINTPDMKILNTRSVEKLLITFIKHAPHF